MARPLTSVSGGSPRSLVVHLGDGHGLSLDHAPDLEVTQGGRTETVAAVLERLGERSAAIGLHVVRRSPEGDPPVAEVVIPERTSPAHLEAVLAALEASPAIPIACRDTPGRIVDRLMVTAWLESGRCGPPAGGWLSATDGPADLREVRRALHDGLGGDRYAGPGAIAAGPAPTQDQVALAVIAEAYRMVEEGVAATDAIDRATTTGAGWPSGPFALAGAIGLRALVTELVALARSAPDAITADRFEMPALLWAMAMA